MIIKDIVLSNKVMIDCTARNNALKFALAARGLRLRRSQSTSLHQARRAKVQERLECETLDETIFRLIWLV